MMNQPAAPVPPDIVRSAYAELIVTDLRRAHRFWVGIPSWYAEATTVLDLDRNPRPAREIQQVEEAAVGADGFPAR